MSQMRIFLITFAVLVACFVLYSWLSPGAAVWEEQGRVVLAVRTVPGRVLDTSMVIGIDNMELYTSDGNTERVTVRTRRVHLIPGENELTLMLDTTIPVGTYSGFGFTLQSPELRNAWQENEAPGFVRLVGETVRLDVPFTVRTGVVSSLLLAFETMQAIHEMEGEQVYLPVIQIEARTDVTVQETADEFVEIRDGTITGSATYGMTWDGVMKYNYREKRKINTNTTETLEIQPEAPMTTNSDRGTTTKATSTATTTVETATSTEDTDDSV